MTLFKSGLEQYSISYIHCFLTANRKKGLHTQFSLWQSFGKAKIKSNLFLNLWQSRRYDLAKSLESQNLSMRPTILRYR